MNSSGNVPPANPKLVTMPKSPAFRHDFSPAQMDLVKVFITQMNQAEAAKEAADKHLNNCRMSIGMFMDYLQKEYHMQEDVVWNLQGDTDGTPFMSGTLKPSTKKE